MNKNGLLPLGIAFFAVAASAPNAASAWSITATGTITYDSTWSTADTPLPAFADIPPGSPTFLNPASDFSLVGQLYTETITTNPLVNPAFPGMDCSSLACDREGNTVTGTVPAAYTISVTMDGFTVTDTETSGVYNASYFGPDELGQIVATNCSTSILPCAGGYIEGEGLVPFVPLSAFTQSFTAGASELDAGNQSYFSLETAGGTSRYQFQGSIDSLTVSATPVSVPEPGTFLLMGIGVAASLGVMRLKGARAR